MDIANRIVKTIATVVLTAGAEMALATPWKTPTRAIWIADLRAFVRMESANGTKTRQAVPQIADLDTAVTGCATLLENQVRPVLLTVGVGIKPATPWRTPAHATSTVEQGPFVQMASASQVRTLAIVKMTVALATVATWYAILKTKITTTVCLTAGAVMGSVTGWKFSPGVLEIVAAYVTTTGAILHRRPTLIVLLTVIAAT